MRPVLVLRPEPGASATVRRARELGLEAFAVPLFEIEPVPWDPPDADSFDGLLLTSANAIRHGGEGLKSLRSLPVYAVGEATAEAAREAGFTVAMTGEAGIDALLEMIDGRLNLLHLCGEHHRAAEHAAQGITPHVVYRARPLEHPDIGQAQRSVALVHSPRAGRRFAELAVERGSIAIAAISAAAADSVGSGWAAVHIAEHPSDDALLALAARLCNNPAAT